MLEADKRDNHVLVLNPQDNKFRNVRIKIRNPVLRNDAAWDVAQALFSVKIPKYPEEYGPYLKIIRDVFDVRRNSFLGKIPTEEASRKVEELVTVLPEEQQDEITSLVVGIRDFFDSAQPKKVRRAL